MKIAVALSNNPEPNFRSNRNPNTSAKIPI